MKPLSIAVLGCGRSAQSLHLPALAGIDGARVVALTDADAEADTARVLRTIRSWRWWLSAAFRPVEATGAVKCRH